MMLTIENDEAFEIFQHAFHFRESDRRLRKTVENERDERSIVIVGHPSMVLSAFASELYLKCLLSIEYKKRPNTHDLKKLYDNLEVITQRRLEGLWDADIRKPYRQQLIDQIREKSNEKIERIDLPHALKIGSNAFTELRYRYEGRKTYFLLHDLHNLLHKVIVEIMPHWPSKLEELPNKFKTA